MTTLGRLKRNSKIFKRTRDIARKTLKSYTRKLKIIARSSEEAELCAAAMASESKGTVQLLQDLGYEMKPVLVIDAKATEHILLRQGIGRLEHIDVDPRGCEYAESRVKKMMQTWEPSHSAKH